MVTHFRSDCAALEQPFSHLFQRHSLCFEWNAPTMISCSAHALIDAESDARFESMLLRSDVIRGSGSGDVTSVMACAGADQVRALDAQVNLSTDYRHKLVMSLKCRLALRLLRHHSVVDLSSANTRAPAASLLQTTHPSTTPPRHTFWR